MRVRVSLVVDLPGAQADAFALAERISETTSVIVRWPGGEETLVVEDALVDTRVEGE